MRSGEPSNRRSTTLKHPPVWVTEWIRNTHGDFYTAAIMLNDRLETVIASYAHLLEEDVAEKAYRLIEERNGQEK